MPTRIVSGRERVVREVRAAAPLMADLRAPIPARGPWLTALLNQGAGRRGGGRPVAVVVEPHGQGRPEAVAFLSVRRRGLSTLVTMLGQTLPAPGGRPARRLLARDERAAEQLADGVCQVLADVRGRLDLGGLPLGDPTSRALAARRPDSVIANVRSELLVDALDGVDGVVRSRGARDLERWLPQLLAREPDARSRAFLRATARLHAAIGQLELAVVADGSALRAGLLSLVDGGDRWPWWGWSDAGGLGAAMGAPLVGLTEPVRGWP